MGQDFLHSLSGYLEATAWSHAMQAYKWIVPAVQTVHILAISFLMIMMLLISLNLLLPKHRQFPIGFAQLLHTLRPFVGIFLFVLLASGCLLVIGEPARALLNPYFQSKMLLVISGASLLAWLQYQSRHTPREEWRPTTASLVGVLNLSIWIAVIVAGRWIAYL